MPQIGFAVLVSCGLFAGAAYAEEVPDAVAVEWKGKPPCETLYEDAQIRVARCTFPPGAVHVRHRHPAFLTYVLQGGRTQSVQASGSAARETQVDQLLQSPAVPWHEVTNVGDTTIRYLIIEKKYEAAKAEAPAAKARP